MSSDELTSALSTMKKELRHKKKKLRKYDKVLKAKRHVRETIIREGSKEFKKEEKLGLDSSTLVPSRVVTFEDKTLNFLDRTQESNTGTSTVQPRKSKDDGSVLRIPYQNYKFDLNKPTLDFIKCKKVVESQDIFQSQENILNKNIDSFDVDLDVNTSFITHCSFQSEQTKISYGIDCDIKSFNNENGEIAKESSRRLDDNDKNSPNNEFQDLNVLNVTAPIQNNEVPCVVPQDEAYHWSMNLVFNQSLVDSELGDIFCSNISIEKEMPCILFVCHGGISLWFFDCQENSFSEVEKKIEMKIDVFRDFNLRPYVVCNLPYVENIHYMVFLLPTASECPLGLVFLQILDSENVITSSNIDCIIVCPQCQYIACGISEWLILMYLKPCKICQAVDSHGKFISIYFDCIYSRRKNKWVLDIETKQLEMFWTGEIISCKYIFCKEKKDLFMWQDSTNVFGISKIECGSHEVLWKGKYGDLLNPSIKLLWVAAIHDEIFLLLENKTVSYMVTVDIFMDQFDSFFTWKLSEYFSEEHECSRGAVFYSGRFLVSKDGGRIMVLPLS